MARPTRSQFLVRPTRRYFRGRGTDFELGKKNRVFENGNLWPILFSKVNFGEIFASPGETIAPPGETIASPRETTASPVSPVLRPLRFKVKPRIL